MRLATVIGRVTLSKRHESLVGERLLVALPWSSKTLTTGKDHDYSIVVYDQLGANVGSTIGVCESTEATRPFVKPTPIDAYCASLIDEIFYQPQEPVRAK